MCQIASVITVDTLQYLSWKNLMDCSEIQSQVYRWLDASDSSSNYCGYLTVLVMEELDGL